MTHRNTSNAKTFIEREYVKRASAHIRNADEPGVIRVKNGSSPLAEALVGNYGGRAYYDGESLRIDLYDGRKYRSGVSFDRIEEVYFIIYNTGLVGNRNARLIECDTKIEFKDQTLDLRSMVGEGRALVEVLEQLLRQKDITRSDSKIVSLDQLRRSKPARKFVIL